MAGGIFKEEIEKKEEEIELLKFKLGMLNLDFNKNRDIAMHKELDLKRTREELEELKEGNKELKKENERLKRVEYALTGMVSGRDNQLLAFKASLSEARKGADESSQTQKRCEELQKELNRLKKAVAPEYLKEKIDALVRELQLKDELMADLKSSFKKSTMQSKIDRLKKGNQDLQAKLDRVLEDNKNLNADYNSSSLFATPLEKRLVDENVMLLEEIKELKADNDKYHIHNNSLFLMNEDLRGAVAFHKEGNYEKIKNLEKESYEQDNEHFSKCSEKEIERGLRILNSITSYP
jgi:chromosome segregation ATPase